ncbi:MAG: hypothetical protein ACTSW1_00835 [Candidatus Hodarchaeales archaeon]
MKGKFHSHDPETLRTELIETLEHLKLRIEYLSAAATPLASVATSSSVLTFLSLQLFMNGYYQLTRLLAGFNIVLLLFMVFISLISQVMIYRARLRLNRVNHDLTIINILDKKEFSVQESKRLVHLSHLAEDSTKTMDRIQWLYVHGLFNVLYAFISLSVFLLITLILLEIPFRIES